MTQIKKLVDVEREGYVCGFHDRREVNKYIKGTDHYSAWHIGYYKGMAQRANLDSNNIALCPDLNCSAA